MLADAMGLEGNCGEDLGDSSAGVYVAFTHSVIYRYRATFERC